MTDEQRQEIVPQSIAKRRLLIYTLLRLAGLVVLAGGVLLAVDKVTLVNMGMIVIGAASLFIRPKLLARVLGAHW